jgi:hypothetical protein
VLSVHMCVLRSDEQQAGTARGTYSALTPS